MAKSLFEQLGGTYHEKNGYLIPDLRLPAEEEQPIGTWGQRLNNIRACAREIVNEEIIYA